jgi:hypothetical protein
MKNFNMEGSDRTPTISMNAESGEMEFSGKSIPENSADLYTPVIEWVDEYIKTPGEKTIFIVKLEYFNTSSSKYLLEIFRRFEGLFKTGKDVSVQWYYEQEDEDMQESGDDFRDILKIPVELIVY